MKGATIQRTREISGCSIKIEKSSQDPRYNNVSLYGTREQVDMAYNDILMNIQMSGTSAPKSTRSTAAVERNRFSNRGRSYNGRRDVSPERRRDSREERSFVMMIPKMKIGGLIGKKGDSINYIRRESRCRVVVKDEKGASQDSSKREVVIYGPDHDIQVAKRLIRDRLEMIDPETGADLRHMHERDPPRYHQYQHSVPYVLFSLHNRVPM